MTRRMKLARRRKAGSMCWFSPMGKIRMLPQLNPVPALQRMTQPRFGLSFGPGSGAGSDAGCPMMEHTLSKLTASQLHRVMKFPPNRNNPHDRQGQLAYEPYKGWQMEPIWLPAPETVVSRLFEIAAKATRILRFGNIWAGHFGVFLSALSSAHLSAFRLVMRWVCPLVPRMV